MKIYIFILLLLTFLFSVYGAYKEARRARAHGKSFATDFYTFVVFTIVYGVGCVGIWFIDGEAV